METGKALKGRIARANTQLDPFLKACRPWLSEYVRSHAELDLNESDVDVLLGVQEEPRPDPKPSKRAASGAAKPAAAEESFEISPFPPATHSAKLYSSDFDFELALDYCAGFGPIGTCSILPDEPASAEQPDRTVVFRVLDGVSYAPPAVVAPALAEKKPVALPPAIAAPLPARVELTYVQSVGLDEVRAVREAGLDASYSLNDVMKTVVYGDRSIDPAGYAVRNMVLGVIDNTVDNFGALRSCAAELRSGNRFVLEVNNLGSSAECVLPVLNSKSAFAFNPQLAADKTPASEAGANSETPQGENGETGETGEAGEMEEEGEEGEEGEEMETVETIETGETGETGEPLVKEEEEEEEEVEGMETEAATKVSVKSEVSVKTEEKSEVSVKTEEKAEEKTESAKKAATARGQSIVPSTKMIALNRAKKRAFADSCARKSVTVDDLMCMLFKPSRLNAPVALLPPPPPLPMQATFQRYERSPTYKNDLQLREYQVVSLNWMIEKWRAHEGMILGDEMGLGKTIQVIALLHHFIAVERQEGPYLVISPLSTLKNWMREFATWTSIRVCCYHSEGKGKEERQLIQSFNWFFKGLPARGLYKFNVLLTTYEVVMKDWGVLGDIAWQGVVMDEAHRMRNNNCKFMQFISKVKTEHKLLLTGTPLQNNTGELWPLLNFIEVKEAGTLTRFQEEFGDLRSNEQVEKLRALLASCMLRRVKEDVEKSIPRKQETIIVMQLTTTQKQYYKAIYDRNRSFLYKGCKKSTVPSLMHIETQLRKVCNHPFLIKARSCLCGHS